MWRQYVPWLVPAILLVAAVAVLAVKWHIDATPMAFPDDLKLPPVVGPGGFGEQPADGESSREMGSPRSG
jgi:hypothetical protein